MSLVKGFVNFVYLFKEPAPRFIDPLNCFLVSLPFNSALILFPSFYSLWAFLVIPLVPLGVGLGYNIYILIKVQSGF